MRAVFLIKSDKFETSEWKNSFRQVQEYMNFLEKNGVTNNVTVQEFHIRESDGVRLFNKYFTYDYIDEIEMWVSKK